MRRRISKKPATLFHKKISEFEDLNNFLSNNFHGVEAILNEHMVIFGGVVRDILADEPPKGDIDIIMPGYHFSRLDRRLSSSANWTRVVSNKDRYRNILSDISVRTYANVDGKRLQIVSSSDIFNTIATSDLLCCCVYMNKEGHIYELSKDAGEDCIDMLLRINPKANIKDIELLQSRINSLVERGWDSEINKELLDKLRIINKRKEKRTKERAKRRNKIRSNKLRKIRIKKMYDYAEKIETEKKSKVKNKETFKLPEHEAEMIIYETCDPFNTTHYNVYLYRKYSGIGNARDFLRRLPEVASFDPIFLVGSTHVSSILFRRDVKLERCKEIIKLVLEYEENCVKKAIKRQEEIKKNGGNMRAPIWKTAVIEEL